MVIQNVSSGFSVIQGIFFFNDSDFQRPLAFVGILLVIAGGMWWTINQSIARTAGDVEAATPKVTTLAPAGKSLVGALGPGYVPPVLVPQHVLALQNDTSVQKLLARVAPESELKTLPAAGELSSARKMPLRLDIKKKLSARSDRVKCVDFHPTEPWTLSALYSGNIFIWDYNTQTLVKQFEVCNLPVRCAKFVTRKQWIATASDDMHIRVFNYNSLEKAHEFEAGLS
eukprot:g30434.t1